jgi:sulfite reductase (NADPH) flavoprotein alpha-component
MPNDQSTVLHTATAPADAPNPAGLAQRRPARRWSLSTAFPALTLKQVWFQLHWFIGITAGSVLVVIGLTGAILSFRDEWLDLLNPGVRNVPVQADVAPLTPAQIAAAIAAERGADAHIASIAVSAKNGEAMPAARVAFAPPAGQRRGETIYADPYTGAQQPALRGADFFEWVESLHRWLLLPRDTGRTVAGTLAMCLLGMALSGLYLRWPRRPLAWRNWLTFDPALRGRSFLWGLHSVLGTWMLVVYLVSTSTGIYWGFDFVRDHVDAWAGGRPGRDVPAMGGDKKGGKAGGKEGKEGKEGRKPAGPVDLVPAWTAFQQQAGAWQLAVLRVPERASQPVQITWLAADAPHERARSRMVLPQAGGKASLDERYEQLSTSAHFLAVIYPLHLGTYFGLPGRIAMMLGGLSLPAFAVTGWMLYLGRRRQSRAVLAERAALAGLAAAVPVATSPQAVHDTLLLAYASQSGQAEKLALQSAGLMRRAGLAVSVAAVDTMHPADLGQYGRVLFVASSFGEGEAPDGARRFARLLQQGGVSLAGLHYGVLALGDRHYERFCGFGHTLDEGLRHLGARALFPLIEVDDNDVAALARWSHTLAGLAGVHGATGTDTDAAALLMPAAVEEAAYRRWRLLRRELLNPGSLGGPLVEVTLGPIDDDGIGRWQPGALADVLPRHAPAAVSAFLERIGLSGEALVQHGAEQTTLAGALAGSVLPTSATFASAQACADSLTALAPRSYSLASLPQDGVMQLLVRQERHADALGGQELGLASGWLTALAPLDSEVALRLVANPAFAPTMNETPCIFIGNGSGFAGLRAHLRSRARAGQRRNWLLFGERQRAHDHICAGEIDGWLAAGFLERLDLVFSREPSGRTYVQDRLREAHEELRAWIAQGAVIYVCGSLKGMASGVDEALVEILGRGVLEDLSAEGRYRRDVY